jgi:amino acid transporter
MLAWILPIIGLPIGIAALVLGVLGIKRSLKGMSVAGIVLAVICLVLTIVNSAIGAYQGYHGEAWFQKGSLAEAEKEEEHTAEKNVFTLRDSDGTILMTGGIKSAQVETSEDAFGVTSYAVVIEFTDSAAETFSRITEEHIGEPIGIYLNDEMISNPTVEAVISGGTCWISGQDSYKEAEELASLLRSAK